MEFRKKFQGIEFRDFYELAGKVTKYDKLIKEKKINGERPLWELTTRR